MCAQIAVISWFMLSTLARFTSDLSQHIPPGACKRFKELKMAEVSHESETDSLQAIEADDKYGLIRVKLTDE